MNPDNITAIGLFIAAQTIAGVAAFFTVRADRARSPRPNHRQH